MLMASIATTAMIVVENESDIVAADTFDESSPKGVLPVFFPSYVLYHTIARAIYTSQFISDFVSFQKLVTDQSRTCKTNLVHQRSRIIQLSEADSDVKFSGQPNTSSKM